MAIQVITCGACSHREWIDRCDGCEYAIGREEPALRIGQMDPRNIEMPTPATHYGRQVVLCGECATAGVDLLLLLSTPPKGYPELQR